MKVSNFLVEHNIPFAVTNHLSPLFRNIFPDSSIAKKYASCSTKTVCMLNLAIAPHFNCKFMFYSLKVYSTVITIATVVEEVKVSPFSLLVDGSNDTGLEKLNPLTVKIFDVSQRKVKTLLLDMCTTSGRDCGTATAIFTKIDTVLDSYSIPWEGLQ